MSQIAVRGLLFCPVHTAASAACAVGSERELGASPRPGGRCDARAQAGQRPAAGRRGPRSGPGAGDRRGFGGARLWVPMRRTGGSAARAGWGLGTCRGSALAVAGQFVWMQGARRRVAAVVVAFRSLATLSEDAVVVAAALHAAVSDCCSELLVCRTVVCHTGAHCNERRFKICCGLRTRARRSTPGPGGRCDART